VKLVAVPPQPAPAPETVTWTRTQAVNELRRALVELTDAEHSLCSVASEQRIFCFGFSRWSEPELRRRLRHLLERRPRMRRTELENLANTCQLMRQYIDGAAVACDVEAIDHELCRGWDDFGNADLARFCYEILKKNVVVVDSPPFSGQV